ncbi:unnamed protein product, partial [Ixodes hexagonus]
MVCCRLRLKRASKSMLRRAPVYLSAHSAFSLRENLKYGFNIKRAWALGWGTFGGTLLAFIARVHPTAGHISHNVIIRTLPADCDTIVHIHEVFKQDVTQGREQIRVFGGRRLHASSIRIIRIVRCVRCRHG